MFTLKKEQITTFDFKVEGNKATYKIPLLQHLPMDIALAAGDLAEKDEAEVMFYIKGIFDKYAPDVVGNLTGSEFGELVQAYFKACGVGLGE